MKQERLKVLSMLEEGKISADEAATLLEKLNQADHHYLISEDTAEQVEEILHRFEKTAEGFAKEFSQKAAEAYKDVEPKLKKASQTVLEKTASIVDDIAQSLHETIENAKARAEQCEAAGDESKPDDDDTPKPN